MCLDTEGDMRCKEPEEEVSCPALGGSRQVGVTCSLTVSGASLAGSSWEFMAHSTIVAVVLAFWLNRDFY